MVNTAEALVRSAVAALRPGAEPVAAGAALRALLAAGVVAVCGARFGDLRLVGAAYLGMSCSVAFLPIGTYRIRLNALLASATGGAIGICMGALLPPATPVLITTAVVAGMVSGLVGPLGQAGPGFGAMLSIGVAFGQFRASSLPWWQQALGYLLGAAVVAAVTFSPWLFRRAATERRLVAAVYFAIADMCDVLGTDRARTARLNTVAVASRARTAAGYPAAEAAAVAAAALYAHGHQVPPEVPAAIRTAGRQVCAGEAVNVSVKLPGECPAVTALAETLGSSDRPHRPNRPGLGAVLRPLSSPTTLANGVRIAVCMGMATAFTATFHAGPYAFWLPVTVAVIVRPEFASVFVRTVNRVAGTAVGAMIAAGVLWWHPSGLTIAIAAAVAQAFAVLTAPKLYGLNVVGVTATVLLSTSIGAVDRVLPGLRVIDTAAGAAIAIVFGYLLWPGARRLPVSLRLDEAIQAARGYLAEAVKPPAERVRLDARRADAYHLAHRVREAAQAAIIEPPPVGALASAIAPAAIELEEVVDAISAVAAAVAVGHPLTGVTEIEARLAGLERDATPTRTDNS